jgi:homoserine kinase
MQSIRVRVPCSTSNLGAGFDCIGLALNRYLTATLHPGATELVVERTGTLGGIEDSDDLLLAALRAMDCNVRGTLVLDSEIPIGRGLGSSAAATLAGCMIAARADGQTVVDHDWIAAQATSLEGHPDNAVPAAYGGLMGAITETWDGTATVRVHRLRLSEQLGFAFAAPQATVATKAARRALPEQVTHEIATRAIARTLALIEGLADADAELLRIGFNDELHVPYRLPMIPGGADALHAAVAAGAYAATISGSGSGLLAVCARGHEAEVVIAMRDAFERATAQSADGFVVVPDQRGAQYLNA